MNCNRYANHDWGRGRLLAAALLLLIYQLLPEPVASALDDAAFRAAYIRQYDQVMPLSADMVVEELRLRVELVASRGSQVGAASNDRRVRSFESVLLKGLRDTLCPGGKPRPALPARPSAPVIESVTAAANSQQLRTVNTDVAELSALTQRLIDLLQAARWCTLISLDEIR